MNTLINNCRVFEPEIRRPFVFHPVNRETIAESRKESVMEVNAMLDLVDSLFPHETGLYKKGARFDEKIALLFFNFPDLNLFRVRLSTLMDDLDTVKNDFIRQTGMELIIDSGEQEDAAYAGPVKCEEYQMEQNQALAVIQEAFEGKEDKLYKKSVKSLDEEPAIELAFISPVVGNRYLNLIDELESSICWKIVVNRTPNQNEILNVGRRIIERQGLSLKKNLSYLPVEMKVRVVLQERNTNAEELFRAEFERITGLEMEIKG